MTLHITKVGCDDDPKWDDFVSAHPKGSIYHHSAWRRVLQSTYRYPPLYLAVRDAPAGSFQGIWPLMLVASRFTGDRLVSLPFTSYCTPLVPEGALPELVQFNLAQYPQVSYLEVKALEALPEMPDFLVPESQYMTHLLDLGVGEKALYQGFHSTSVRQRINRAQKQELKLRLAEKVEDLKHFYRLHLANRKKHGLPPHPFRFFRNMWNELMPRNLLVVPLLEYRGEVVAGAITLKFKDTFILEYSATAEAFLSVCANQMLIWETIKMGCREGARYFDFGRSSLDNPTLIEFKERWGAKGEKLHYYYYPKMTKVGVEGSRGRRLLNRANRLLPGVLLQLEGELVYPHLG